MLDKEYIELIKNGKKLENGLIRLIIPCDPLAISSHNESLQDYLKRNGYKLINLQYHDKVRKLLGYVKRRDFK